MDAYRKLEQRFARCAAIEDAVGVLEWDAQTMLPAGAMAGRSDQIATLKVLSHEILTARAIEDDFAAVAEGELDVWQTANLREMRRRYRRAVAVPPDLLEASSRAASLCQHVWQEARQKSDFAAVAPHLADVVRTQREIGAALGAALGQGPYDALLDRFDLGATRAGLDLLFAPLKRALPELIGVAVERQKSAPPALPLSGLFAKEAQERLGRKVLAAMGFDFARGRLDVSAHPFSGGAFGDVRITTRYDETDFLSGLMAVIHEGGHALYEQGRPLDWRSQPVGESRGMSIHESQSLSFEMQAARSPEFLAFLEPLVREAFGDRDPSLSAANLRRLAIAVEPGFIRVDADEVTYPAHVLLRYRIEAAMMAGDLDVADLPGAFNEAVKEFLGLDVPDDRRGCLQDIHWYGGAFGYFPTYLVGAMTAAQLFDAARRERADLVPGLAAGDFTPLRDWMRRNIHAKGSLLDRDELIAAATGGPLDAAIFRRHLESRYCA